MKRQRHQPDFMLLVTILLLVGIGITMVYSASTVFALANGYSASYFFLRQSLWAVLGLIAMTVMMNIPYRLWAKLAGAILLINLVMLVTVLIPGIGLDRLGGRRWLGTSSIAFQPSEVAIIGLTIYLSYILSKKMDRLHHFKRGVLPVVLVTGAVFGLIILEKDLGTASLFLLTALGIIFAAGVPMKHLVKTLVVAVPAVVLVALSSPYRRERVLAYLHAHKGGVMGWQLQNSLFAINSGGWFGRGLGQSIEKFLWLPEAHTDFIFAILTEEWGLIGASFVLLLFGIIIWRGILIATRVEDQFASLLAVGISTMVGVGVAINLFAVTGIIPVTGIPLPFISYGGTALVFKMMAMGLMLNVSRYTIQKEQDVRAPLASGSVQSLPHSR